MHVKMRNAYQIFVGQPEREHLGDFGLDGRMILK
jgi:hypothetical protein